MVRSKTPEYKAAYWKEYYSRPEVAERLRAKARAKHPERLKKIKAEVFALLGDKCACCGEDNKGFLTIDHKFNDGAKDRKQNKFGAGFVLGRRILKQEVDITRLQILCYNCNLGRQFSGTGKCPHEVNNG